MDTTLKTLDYKWVKENIALIVLLPTIAGGFWQLLELAGISLAYIRFFSLSQLVPDGLLILFFTSVFGSLILFYGNLKALDTQDPDRFTPKQRPPKSLLNLYVFMYFFTFLFVMGAWRTGIKEYLKFWQIVVAMAAMCMYFLVTIIRRAINGNLLNLSNNKKTRVLVMVYCVLAGFSTVCLMQFFHYGFALPDNCKNLNYIDCVVRSHNKNFKRYEILYFNDKYIFVKISTSERSYEDYIEILKFEEFINFQDCITPSTKKL